MRATLRSLTEDTYQVHMVESLDHLNSEANGATRLLLGDPRQELQVIAEHRHRLTRRYASVGASCSGAEHAHEGPPHPR